MKGFNGKTVLQVIQEHYSQIFMAERKVADFILANPEKAVSYNVSELANQSNVSDATVIRLCKHIGFEGYYQLKLFLSRDLGRKQVSDEEDITDSTVKTLDDFMHGLASNVVAVGRELGYGNLMECVELIRKCGYVHLVGAGNTSTLAQYIGFRLGRLGIRSTYNMVSLYFINQINLAGPDDIVLAISRSGSTKKVVQALQLAKEKKLRIIAITGHQYSPVSRLADHLLLSGSSEQTVNIFTKHSLFSEMAVIEALLHFLTDYDTASDEKPEFLFSEYKL